MKSETWAGRLLRMYEGDDVAVTEDPMNPAPADGKDTPRDVVTADEVAPWFMEYLRDYGIEGAETAWEDGVLYVDLFFKGGQDATFAAYVNPKTKEENVAVLTKDEMFEAPGPAVLNGKDINVVAIPFDFVRKVVSRYVTTDVKLDDNTAVGMDKWESLEGDTVLCEVYRLSMRGGKVVKTKVKRRKKRLTAAQKAKMAKNLRKAHTGAAARKRAKSVAAGKKKGLYKKNQRSGLYKKRKHEGLEEGPETASLHDSILAMALGINSTLVKMVDLLLELGDGEEYDEALAALLKTNASIIKQAEGNVQGDEVDEPEDEVETEEDADDETEEEDFDDDSLELVDDEEDTEDDDELDAVRVRRELGL